MREEDLLRFVWVADPQISPDGARVAFTRVAVDIAADEYRTSLWVVEGAGGAPRPLTFGAYDLQPRWSPDGTRLAFVRKTEAKKPGQLWLLPMAGGEAAQVTRLEGGASEPAWSPDGARLAFLSGTNPALDDPKKEKPKNAPARVVTRPEFRMNDEGFTDHDHLDHVWVVEVAASGDPGAATPRQLTTGKFKEQNLRWSRDGKWILFVSDRRAEPWFDVEDWEIWAVAPDLAQPTEGAELKLVADIHGPLNAYAEAADGRIAAVGGIRPSPPRSYDQPDLLLFEGRWPRTAPRVLTQDYDGDIGDGISADQHPPRGGGAMPLGFTDGGRAVLTVAGRHGAAMLARIALDTGKIEELTDAQHEVIAGSVTPDGARVALTLGGLTRPGDLYLYDVARRSLTKLHAPNDAWMSEVKLGEIEELWFDSFDGRKIQGWIVKPPDFDPAKKYPAILEIHGGPHVAYGVAFFHEFRVLAAAGYVVLYTNPRGSTTYGQEFGNVIQYRYPGDDYRDLMAGVDELIGRGYVDETRLGVLGGSGGGLLTNWIVGQTGRFKAAITQRCVADWDSMYYSSDFTLFTPVWFRKPPYEDPQEYRERSPVKFATRVTTPLMVIHSEEDWRTPIAQGETMFRALKQQRKEVVMVRFPGESHELSRSGTPSRRVQNQQHIRRWFDKWLQGKPAPEYDA
ncbi:MAG: S9 family peptidase [Candidatus Eisenbacteria bacterium]|nr:S9 family peptidase [Candidatus Eisenbacteria bacterium]